MTSVRFDREPWVSEWMKEDKMAKNYDQKIQAKRERDARVKREKRAAARGNTLEAFDAAVREAGIEADEPAPVRLTLAALAQDYENECQAVNSHQAALDASLVRRMKARTALDQAAARLAEGT